MNNKMPIFMGLPEITAEAAMELAYYWRKAGGKAVGIIDNLGWLRYGDDFKETWERPCADKNSRLLKEAFAGCDNPAVQVEEDQIKVDFGKLRYNLEFIKELMRRHGLGVCDPKDDESPERGLIFYEPRDSGANGTAWYREGEWRFRDVTVKDLELPESRACALSPHTHSPDEAKWKTLYFAAA